jgi:hypothetical protein
MKAFAYGVSIPVELFAELKKAHDEYVEACGNLNQYAKDHPVYSEERMKLYNAEYCYHGELQKIERKICDLILGQVNT